MPRPTVLTPELQAVVCAFIKRGATVPEACAMADVSWNTVKEWLKPDMREREPYASFVEAVDTAKAAFTGKVALDLIETVGAEDWKALAWMIERRRPEDYSVVQKTSNEHTGKGGGPMVNVAVTMTREEALRELAEELEDNPELLKRLGGK